MSNPTYTSRPSETEADGLVELALNLRWTWNHAADELWNRLDPELWQRTLNPWLVLQTVSQEKLRAVRSDPAFARLLDEALEEKRGAPSAVTWFQQNHSESPLGLVAYFSMEYLLAEALPIYSGGLGNVAGDQLKAASDLGVPVVGIGLLYSQGYFRQEFDTNGNQVALYPFNDPGMLPIKPLREANGEWVRIRIALPGLHMWARAWQVEVGRLKLYLLDSNDPANPPNLRSVTSELYGGGPETRIRQEILLGIGGWRLLRALGLNPQVMHLNEGHAGFAVLERAHSWMAEQHQPFDIALIATRAGNVFTTHTAVDAGFDRFAPELVAKYFSDYAENQLGIGIQDLLALGRRDGSPSEPFNMAYLAMRGSGAVNGVSRLHGQVSRRLFQPLFPRWPEADVPVGHVTNGVHVATWESAEADAFWRAACGSDRWLGETEHLEPALRRISDLQLWQLRAQTTHGLVDFARQRLAQQLESQGAPQDQVEAASRIFDPDILTMGFARRFATYKRPNLLLHDPDRLLRILANRERPAQLIIAGKAHPQDSPGQALIRQWNDFIRYRPEARAHVVFLSDYDKVLTQNLVRGVDLWINTPRRPWEASGTSGMKVLVNGGLNLSELDGWWAEAYVPEVGWAIGDGREHGDDPGWDAAEADQLYSVLEHDVIPAFYERDEQGVPRRWVAKMRESLARLTPQFSANRTVRQYTEQHYLPAASAYCSRAASSGKQAGAIREWQRQLAFHWNRLRFGDVHIESDPRRHVFHVPVYLDELAPDSVAVEIYADNSDGEPIRIPMSRQQALAGSVGGYLYTAEAPANRPAQDYTPRIVPRFPGVNVPLEAGQILWQK
ncbi:MAG TPA: alpha-glucan family phosphorylase [Bryobacteraceae bacterium]|nr:alpha-glucan family phosphorylase [Bryobacteraceae bacterium]